MPVLVELTLTRVITMFLLFYIFLYLKDLFENGFGDYVQAIINKTFGNGTTHSFISFVKNNANLAAGLTSSALIAVISNIPVSLIFIKSFLLKFFKNI